MSEDIKILIDEITDLTKLDLSKSTFSTYSDKDEIYDTTFVEETGFFVPRKLHGYIKSTNNKNESKRRKIHEISHGFYLENFPVGQKIVYFDKEIERVEKELFGNILGKNEKILVITNLLFQGTYPITDIDEELKKLIPDDIDISRYNFVAFLENENFKEYKNFRNKYEELIKSDIENQEGFCTLIEYEIISEHNPEFAEQIFWLNLESDSVYGRGFKKLRAMECNYGLNKVLEYLESEKYEL